MFNLIPIVIIFVSLLVIVVIVLRRYHDVLMIDPDTIPEERDRKKKEEILFRRLTRKLSVWRQQGEKIFRPISVWIKQKFIKWYSSILERERAIRRDSIKLTDESAEDFHEELKKEAEELSLEKEYELAEQKYIDMLEENTKDIDAYLGLAELYEKRGETKLSTETLRHVLKIEPGEARAFFRLIELEEKQGNIHQASQYAKEALEFHPKNPKFLDAFIELSILKSDKKSAQEALLRLEEANPENAKLDEFREKIRELKK